LNLTEIRKLIKMVEDSNISEIEISEGETSVRISRQNHASEAALISQPIAAAPVAPMAAAAVEVTTTAPVSQVEPDDANIVKSPMVGTFYSASSPDADPFVVEGQSVKKGETLCIIEAMKLMNEIEAEYNGVVEKILVDNATPLEFGQAMFVVKPA